MIMTTEQQSAISSLKCTATLVYNAYIIHGTWFNGRLYVCEDDNNDRNQKKCVKSRTRGKETGMDEVKASFMSSR